MDQPSLSRRSLLGGAIGAAGAVIAAETVSGTAVGSAAAAPKETTMVLTATRPALDAPATLGALAPPSVAPTVVDVDAVLAAGQEAEYVCLPCAGAPGGFVLDHFLMDFDPEVGRLYHRNLEASVESAKRWGMLLGYALAKTEHGDRAGWAFRAIDLIGYDRLHADPNGDARESYEECRADPAGTIGRMIADEEEWRARAATWEKPTFPDWVEGMRALPGWPGNAGRIAHAVGMSGKKMGLPRAEIVKAQAAILGAAHEEAKGVA